MKIPWNGADHEAARVEFDVTSDPWIELSLADGSQLRIKPVVTDVYKIDQTNAAGDPVYVVKAVNIIATRPPQVSIKPTITKKKRGAQTK